MIYTWMREGGISFSFENQSTVFLFISSQHWTSTTDASKSFVGFALEPYLSSRVFTLWYRLFRFRSATVNLLLLERSESWVIACWIVAAAVLVEIRKRGSIEAAVEDEVCAWLKIGADVERGSFEWEREFDRDAGDVLF